jgi:hypothetical protein
MAGARKHAVDPQDGAKEPALPPEIR